MNELPKVGLRHRRLYALLGFLGIADGERQVRAISRADEERTLQRFDADHCTFEQWKAMGCPPARGCICPVANPSLGQISPSCPIHGNAWRTRQEA